MKISSAFFRSSTPSVPSVNSTPDSTTKYAIGVLTAPTLIRASPPSSAWVTARAFRCPSTIAAIAATISRTDVASNGKK